MGFENKSAQSLAESALVISLVLAALIGMQTYVKRGFQARVRTFVDAAGKGSSAVAGLNKALSQYEPYYLDSELSTQQSQKVAAAYAPKGRLRRTFLSGENWTKRSGIVQTKGVREEDLRADDGWQD